jgi:hypothetical protein
MAVNAANARIWGNDKDAIFLAAVGATMPTGIAIPGTGFTDVGWLDSEGITFTPNAQVSEHRGHQGGAVVRTTVSESDLSIKFTCLETTALTLGLVNNIKTTNNANGITTMTANAAFKVLRRAAVVDVYDADDDLIYERYCFPVLEIGERAEVKKTRSGITTYTFTGKVIGDYTIITKQPGLAAA